MTYEEQLELYRFATTDGYRQYGDYIQERCVTGCVSGQWLNYAEKSFTAGVDSRGDRVESACIAYGVPCKVVGTQTGPVIAKIFIKLAPGVLAARLESIARDLARDIGVASVVVDDNDSFDFRDPYSGETLHRCCSIALPVDNRTVVPFGNVANHRPDGMKLPAAIGVDPVGRPVWLDIAKAPHMLVAGQTGSGKSVCINALITSLQASVPMEDLRFILVDPKMVELKSFERLPNLINGRIITDPAEAVQSIGWLVSLMEARYSLLASLGFRNIAEFNDAVDSHDGILKIPQGMRRHLPYVVAVVDEFADLMMTAPADLTAYVMRIAQKARAIGIHLVLATQRPSTKVITGDLKCNIPTRISFKVASATDSTTILGCGGAEKLLGKGDMLIAGDGIDGLRRVHGCLLSDQELQDTLGFSANPDFLDCASADFQLPATLDFEIPGIPAWVYDYPAMLHAGYRPVDLSTDTRSLQELDEGFARDFAA